MDTGTPLPALPMQKALTVVILRDDGAEEADACLAKLDKGGAFMVTKSEMFFHQLRLRAAEKPELLEKIDVFYLTDGEYKRCGLRFEDELRWPVGFLQEAWETETKINGVRAGVPPAAMLGKAVTVARQNKQEGVAAPDQGSVRNATDELAAKAIAMLRTAQCPDQRCSDGWIIDNGPDPQHDSCEWCYGRQMLIDAAIRALPVLEAHQKD